MGEIVGDAVGLVGAVKPRQARVPVAAELDLQCRGDAECLEFVYNPCAAGLDRPIDDQAAHRRHGAALVDAVRLEAHAGGDLLVSAPEYAMALKTGHASGVGVDSRRDN